MGYFNDEYVAFFKELDRNNKKEWFDRNRDWYEKSIKEPFTALVEEMIVRIHSDNPNVLIRPSEAIFRINRDIRFSKDKTPYKTHMAALISPGGRKARDVPGFYFQIGKNGIRIYSGVHEVDKSKLEAIRRYLAGNLSRFDKIINEKKFKSYFNQIRGEKHKRLQPEYENVAEEQPLIANKDFYVFADLASEYVIHQDLADQLMAYYTKAKPLLNFLDTALKS